MTPGAQLRSALKAATPDTHDAIKDSGIEHRLFRRAILGQPVNASTHLKLCGLLALDPVTGETTQVRILGDFHWPSLASAFRMRRILDRTTRKQAAAKAKINYATVCRIEYGEAVSIDAVVSVCAFLNRHPFEFCSPRVSHETSGEQRSAA